MAVVVRIEPEVQLVVPGAEAVLTVHVVNHSAVVDRVTLDVLGAAAGWARVDPPLVALFPGAEASATVVCAPPPGTQLGQVPIGIRVTAESSGLVEVGEATLDIGATRVVRAELRPRTAEGRRRATSVIVLQNLGNARTDVQVAAVDPDEAIVFDTPGIVPLGPGTTTELPLRMRLPPRARQEKIRPYSVLLTGDGTSQSVDGQVRQPPKPRWPILAALVVVAALAVAFTSLRPKDSVAVMDTSAETPITTVAAETTTTAPGVTTTVAADAAEPTTTAVTVPGGPTTATPVTPSGSLPPPVASSVGTIRPTVATTTTLAPPPGHTPVRRDTATVVVDTSKAGPDTNGGTLIVISAADPPHGTVTVSDNRFTITYRPDPGYTGADAFTYGVNNGRADGSSEARMQLWVQ